MIRLTFEDAMQGSEEWLKEYVTNIQSWSPMIAPISRITWVRCSGMSLNMWTLDCFKHILLPVGDVINVDEDTSTFTRLEYARIKIRTMALEYISQARKIFINGITYTIRIVEEMCGGHACCCTDESEEDDEAQSGWSLNGGGEFSEPSEGDAEDDRSCPGEEEGQWGFQGAINHSLGDNNDVANNEGGENHNVLAMIMHSVET